MCFMLQRYSVQVIKKLQKFKDVYNYVSAMFCSISCIKEAYKRYHQYECPIMDTLLRSGDVHMALRSFFIALSIFDGSLENLEKFLNENENTRTTIFDIESCRWDEAENDKSRLLMLTSLIKSKKEISLDLHEEALVNHPSLKHIWAEQKPFIKSFLTKQCQIADLSFHGIFGGTSKKTHDLSEMNSSMVFQNLQQPIGSGALLFSTLFNHSCSNNIFRVYVDGNVVCVVCRPISKGSQLFDSYKYVPNSTSVKSHYSFAY